MRDAELVAQSEDLESEGARLRNDPSTDAKSAENAQAGESRPGEGKSHLVIQIMVFGNHGRYN
jgi:hypothetical protein